MKKILKNLTTILLTITLVISFNSTSMAEAKYVEVTCGTIDKTVAIPEADIRAMCEQACEDTDIEPEIIEALCYEESRFNPDAESPSNCVGLCQISTIYYKDKAEKLNITDYYEPYSNIKLCVSIIEDLMNKYDDYELVLMSYNMGEIDALKNYKEKGVSEYAKNILNNAEKIKESKEISEVQLNNETREINKSLRKELENMLKGILKKNEIKEILYENI